jgi:hypothetical protein
MRERKRNKLLNNVYTRMNNSIQKVLIKFFITLKNDTKKIYFYENVKLLCLTKDYNFTR